MTAQAPVRDTGVPAGEHVPVGGFSRYRLGSGAKTLLALPVVFLAVAVALPMGYVLWLAFFGDGDATFGSVLSEPLFREALWRTVLMAFVVTVLCVVLGLVYSLAIAMSPRPVKMLLALAIGATFVVSLMVRTYGWVLLLQPQGIVFDVLRWAHVVHGPLAILQTQPAMYLGMVHVMLPYSILLTSTSLAGLDGNLIKAARSMGAGAWLTFFRVLLPQIGAGITAGALLVFMISLGFYITPAFLGGPGQLTMGTLIGREMGGTFDFKSAAIMGSVLFLAVTALYVLAERTFRITDQWERQ